MDLAKRDTPLRSQPQTTFRRETTMPRQATDLPGLEVNAAIRRPDMSGADRLTELLGLATKTATNIAGDIQENKNNEDTAAALLDYGTGHQNEARYAKSRAYRDAWQLQGAKQKAIEISTDVTDRINARLNDDDNPTPEDIDGIFEKTLHDHLVDERGKLLDFVTPQAKVALGTALAKLKGELMPKAVEAIAQRQNQRLYGTTFQNMLFERDAGQEIGAPAPAPQAPGSAVADGPQDQPAASLSPIPKGWKGTQEDAIQELGMTADQAATFLKTGKDPRTPVTKLAKVIDFGKPTGALPLKGTITSSYAAHLERGSHGVDIDGQMGDPVEAPAGGRVISVGRDAKSGLFVRIDHGDGVVSSYAHLSKTNLKNGDVLQAGDVLGNVGNSGHTVGEGGGDGSHLHWRIKVNGKDVNPLGFAFKDHAGSATVVEDGSEPQLATGQAAPKERLKPGFDVERFMASMPPSVNKGEAKAWLITSLIAQSADSGDTSLLNGLEDSKRKDGTPSFTPDERLKIVETRDRLREKNRIEADRIEKKAQEDNASLVLQAFSADNPPSRSWLNAQARSGTLDSRFVYTMIDHIDAEAKSDAREARSEARMAQADADNTADATVYAMEAARRSGDLSGASYAEDLKRFQNGELGEGKKAAARLLRLQSAAKSGQKAIEADPQFAYYSSKLQTDFKPRTKGDGLLLLKPQAIVDMPTYSAMSSFYSEKVHEGLSPGDAYRQAVDKYAPKGASKGDINAQLDDIGKKIEALQRKRAGR